MMVIRFSDKSGSPLFGNEASYELFDRNGKQLSSGQQPTSPSGALFVTLPTDSTLNGAYAETRLKLGNGTLYKRTFFPEPRTASFDIQFLPEGGNLVPGTPQIVAFKAVQSNGYPAEVRGAILNSAGDTVGFQRRRNCKADGFLGAGGICHYEIGGQGVQMAVYALHRGIEAFQVDCQIGARRCHTSALLCKSNNYLSYYNKSLRCYQEGTAILSVI